ncbi:hypothetical protein A3G06_02015 [Candidatus Nomurabacteria bacterium RIFCSPLOWO2_12_FULL_46_14]|uniref:Uncharacterized protein n=1 Tax=Candidatus Nomurabacteria bacterium RIFCSPLOWO2_12_FULL_46_14 TaxID=1801797 RepID=A0A1F6YB58_9BACT|nr:MAG: hypothetical protein A3G06_02015 [Candidatus Nomurabacteria bacterium RIFCSPLOWO2_12_FULL_46_14]
MYFGKQTKAYGAEMILGILFFATLFLGISIMLADAESDKSEKGQALLSEEAATDSIYRYYSLKNKISYAEMENLLLRARDNSKEAEMDTTATIEKVREAADKFQRSWEIIERTIANIEKKAKVESVLVGASNDVGVLRFQLVQIKDQLRELKKLKADIDQYASVAILHQNIEAMEQAQNRVENFILAEQNKFSFFGWFVSIL